MMKKITMTLMMSLLVSTLLFSLVAAESTVTGLTKFNDVKGHWAENTIKLLVDNNLVDGFPDQTFRPEALIKRDQFLKLTLVAMGHRLEEGSSYWAQPYIDKATEMNLIKANEFSRYNVPISREEMTSVIVQATLLSEEVPTEPSDVDILSNLRDATSIQDQYIQNMLYSYRFGLITGRKQGYFSPKGTSTRAEASTVIARYLDPTLRKPYEVPTEKLHILLEDVKDRQHIFNEGTFIKVYAPTIRVGNGPEVEINDVIETALVIQNTINTMENGYGEIKVNRDESLISATFFPSAESIYRNDHHFQIEDKIYKDEGFSVADNVNLWITIRTSNWGEKKFLAYQITMYKPEDEQKHNIEVIENLFKHLFQNEYPKAMEKFNEIIEKEVSEEYKEIGTQYYDETITYNNRKVYIIKYFSGVFEFFVSELRPEN
jgi:hypothetical protein